jgi:small subunit ribosomal protein S24e
MIREKDSKDNKAIGRKELVFLVKHAGKPQPSRIELEKSLKTKVKEKFFVIRNIKSRFGVPESTVFVHAYKDEKTMKYYEPEHLFKRCVKKEKKPVETPATPEPGKKEVVRPEKKEKEIAKEPEKPVEKEVRAEKKPEKPVKKEAEPEKKKEGGK